MKKTWIIVIAVVLVLALAAAGIWFATRPKTEDALSAVRNRGTLVIATEGTWEPWTYRDRDNNLTGFDIELGRLIADGLGVKADFREMTWGKILDGLEAGQYDIACNGVGYTEERAAKYDFTNPYVYTQAALVVREDNDEISTVKDMKGKKAANSKGSTYAQRSEAAGAIMEYVDGMEEALQMLQEGKVDATINSKDSLDKYMAEHPDANIKLTQIMVGESVAIPAKKGSDTLVAAINEILAKAQENGTLKALSEKYFGTDLTKEP